MRAEDTEEMIQKRAQDLIKAAQEHIAASRWYEAKQATDQAKKQDLKKSHKAAIEELYRRLDAEGQRQLNIAQADYAAKRYLQAIEAYERIFRTFRPLPSAVAAYQALKEARKDPAARAAMIEVRAAALSKQIDEILADCNYNGGEVEPKSAGSDSEPPAQGPGRVERIKKLCPEHQSEAVKLLETIVQRYRKTPTGEQATVELEAVRSAKALMAALTRYRAVEEARIRYAEAEAYLVAGMDEKALECLEQLIKKFPETPAAAEARKKQAELLAKANR